MLTSLIQKLLFINQFNMINGKIEILGGRYIMLDASDLLMLQETDETKMYAVMKDSSKRNLKSMIEHAKVYKSLKDESMKNIAQLSKRIGKDEEGIIKTLQGLFELYGLGSMQIVNLDNKNKQATINIRNSSVALEQLKRKKVKYTACTIIEGILAGMFSYIFNKDVDCVERKCMAKGDEACMFVVEQQS
jgi:predicted hydrocarbon binding protein